MAYPYDLQFLSFIVPLPLLRCFHHRQTSCSSNPLTKCFPVLRIKSVPLHLYRRPSSLSQFPSYFSYRLFSCPALFSSPKPIIIPLLAEVYLTVHYSDCHYHYPLLTSHLSFPLASSTILLLPPFAFSPLRCKFTSFSYLLLVTPLIAPFVMHVIHFS